jgi:hypothetical protein
MLPNSAFWSLERLSHQKKRVAETLELSHQRQVLIKTLGDSLIELTAKP